MSPQVSGHVTALHVYPVKGRPGRDLSEAAVLPEGLEGDRRKKAPVHLVAQDDLRPDTRANIEVSLEPDALAAAVGNVLRVGEVVLDVVAVPSGCPGVYATVRTPGRVRTEDPVTVGAGGTPDPLDP